MTRRLDRSAASFDLVAIRPGLRVDVVRGVWRSQYALGRGSGQAVRRRVEAAGYKMFETELVTARGTLRP